MPAPIDLSSRSLCLAQQDVYYHQIKSPQSPMYNIGGYMHIVGKLDVDRLRKAHQVLVSTADVFSIEFSCDNSGQPYQYLNNNKEPCPLTVYDFRQEHLAAQKATSFLEEMTATPFVVSENIFFKSALILVSDTETWYIMISHHLLNDGWGFVNMIKRFISLYNSRSYLHKGDIQNLSVEYSNYIDSACDDKRYLNGARYQKDKAYWLDKFCVAPERLFSKNTKNSQQLQTSHREKKALDSKLVSKLNLIAEKCGVNNYQIILTLICIYFSRAYRQNEILVGIPTHNRSNKKTKANIGMYAGVYPGVFPLVSSDTFSDCLTKIGSVLRKDFRHQKFPISHLNRELNFYNDQEKQLFDIVFNYELYDYPETLEGLDFNTGIIAHGHESIPLNIFYREYTSEQSDELIFDYNLGYWHSGEVKILLDRVFHLLSVLEPDSCINNLAIIPPSEHQYLIHDLNNTERNYENTPSLLHRIEQQAQKCPANIAVSSGGTHLSYAELNQKANQLAHYLLSLEIGSNPLIGLCCYRSTDMLVGILGILKAGAAYVPLDPTYPANRLAHIVQDSGVQIVVGHTQACSQLPQEKQYTAIHIDSESVKRDIESYFSSTPERAIQADHLAYVIYTSGSTGQPKGVMIEHRNLANFINAMEETPGIAREDTLLSVTSPSFDIHSLELFLPLTVGAQIVIAQESEYADAYALAALIQQHQISIMQATPVTWSLLLNSGWEAPQPLTCLCGGEALSDALKHAFKAHPQLTLWNMYGPTETTVWSTCCQIDNNITLGQPIANTQCYVMSENVISEDMQLQPLGIAGELCIAGAGVARGYWGKPELTQEKFIDNPFSAATQPIWGQRMYRTGDLVRRTQEGELEYLGRIDEQIKLRGFRIELGEIETQLSLQDRVQAAVVCARETSAGEAQLIGYVVIDRKDEKDGKEETDFNREIKTQLRKTLPEYMVPAVIHVIDSLPLTPNGKVDKKQLPEIEFSVIETTYIAAETELEKQLVQLWSQVLDLPETSISCTANFYDLGGDSLNAVRLMSLIRSELGYELDVRDVFEHFILAEMAKHLENRRKTNWRPRIKAIKHTANIPSSYAPSSYAQQGIWLLDQYNSGSAEYNILGALSIQGVLDEQLLEKVLITLIQRHAALRTHFKLVDNTIVQRVNPQAEFKLNHIDKCTDIHHTLKEEQKKPFDLEKDLMLRSSIIKISEDKSIVVIVVHHIAVDGWSLNLLMEEFSQLYEAGLQGTQLQLPPNSLSYLDYSQWQRDWYTSGALDEQLHYWKKQLANLPANNSLSLNPSRPLNTTTKGSAYHFKIKADILARLDGILKKYEVSPFMLLHAVFTILLARYTNKKDIVIGSPSANRQDNALQHMVGNFVNLLVLRSQVNNKHNFIDYLKHIRDINLDAYQNQDIPYEKVVEALSSDRTDRNRSSLFNIMLVMNYESVFDYSIKGLNVEQIFAAHSLSKYDMSLYLSKNGNELEGCLEYKTDLFKQKEIEQFCTHFSELLQSVIETPEQTINTLTLLTDTEHQYLIHDLNNTERNYENTPSLLHRIEQQAQKCPANIAVSSGGTHLSYAELNQKANQLAHYLLSLEIGTNPLIGLCCYRSTDMLVGILGILKAGAAYVPLDPTYPANRLAHIVQDSGVQIVVGHTQACSQLPQEKQYIAIHIDSESVKRDIESYFSSTPERAIQADHLAYVIYTSGSTGQPKGVMIEHRNLANFINAMEETPGIAREDTLLSVTSPSFDIHSLELFLPLTVGAQIVIAQESEYADAYALAALIQQHQISIMQATPVTWSLLLNSGWEAPQPLTCLCGGEALSDALKHAFKAHPQLTLWNMYGPTETTVWSTCCQIDNNITLGQPIANTQCYVMSENVISEDMQLQPLGIAGELCIAGAGVARGYWGKPELTQEKFIDNPFSAATQPIWGQRMYRTGDLVRRTQEGELEYLGRIDEQIKLRGFRIELGEIETQLSLQDRVQAAVVCARTNSAGEAQLIGYVVIDRKDEKDGKEETDFNREIKTQLRKTLPEYMVPAVIHVIDSLPLTPNGKVDKKQLPEIEFSVIETTYIAAETELEKQLVQLWSQVLDLPETSISCTANFYDLGGDSLNAIILARKAKSAGLSIQQRDLIGSPTIKELSKNTTYLPKKTKAKELYSGTSAMTADQLNFLEELNGSSMFNMNVVLDVNEEIEKKQLQSACCEIVKIHDVLRSDILKEEGKWISRISNKFEYNYVQEKTINDHKAESVADEIKLILQEMHDHIHLANEPKFQFCIVRDKKRKVRLIFSISHLVCDKYGMDLLLEDVFQIYRSLGQNQDISLHSSACYSEVVKNAEEKINSNGFEGQINYWQALNWQGLNQVPLDFPANYEKHNTVNTSRIMYEELEEVYTNKLIKYAASINVSIQNCLIALLNYYFSSLLGSRVNAINVFDSGREGFYSDNKYDMSRLVSSSVLFRTIFLENKKFNDINDYVLAIDQQIKNIPHSGVGLSQLKYLTKNKNIKETISKYPTPEIWFNYSGIVNQYDEQIGKTIHVSDLTYSIGCVTLDENYPRKQVFQLPWDIKDRKLRMFWEYGTAIHKESTVKKMAENCKKQLIEWLNQVN